MTDFLLQRWGIGENKRGFNKYMLAHVGITTLFFAFVANYFGMTSANLIFGSILIFISHLSIDVIRQEILAKFKITPKEGIFWNLLGIDQILHIIFIYIAI